MNIDEFGNTPTHAMSPGGKSAALGVGLPDKEFDELAAEAWQLIPENFREKVTGALLRIENVSSADAHARVYMALPESMSIYRKPILDAAAEESGVDFEWGTPNEPMKRRIRNIIRDTIWLAIAEQFGMDEFDTGDSPAAATNSAVL